MFQSAYTEPFEFFLCESLSNINNYLLFCWNFIRPEDPIYVEAAKQSAAAAIRVLNDVLDGKPVQDSLLDR